MATNNEIIKLLKSIRGDMATKSEMYRLRKELEHLRDENESQKFQINWLCQDIANLREEVGESHVVIRDEMNEGIEQIKDDVRSWGVRTQQEMWAHNYKVEKTLKKVNKALAETRLGVERLVVAEIQRLQDEEEKEKEKDAPRKDSGVSFGGKGRPQVMEFGSANGY